MGLCYGIGVSLPPCGRSFSIGNGKGRCSVGVRVGRSPSKRTQIHLMGAQRNADSERSWIQISVPAVALTLANPTFAALVGRLFP